jgi:hypothetical protein
MASLVCREDRGLTCFTEGRNQVGKFDRQFERPCAVDRQHSVEFVGRWLPLNGFITEPEHDVLWKLM